MPSGHLKPAGQMPQSPTVEPPGLRRTRPDGQGVGIITERDILRAVANDLDPEEEFDLAQWYNVLNLELELKPFPRGIGPLEIVEFYGA